MQHELVAFGTPAHLLPGKPNIVQLRQIGGGRVLLLSPGPLLSGLSSRAWPPENHHDHHGVAAGDSLGIELVRRLGSLGLGFVWETLDVTDRIPGATGGGLGWLAIRSLTRLLGPRAVEPIGPRHVRPEGQPSSHA